MRKLTLASWSQKESVDLPPELLYDILADCIMKTIDELVHEEDITKFTELWETRVTSLLKTSRSFSHVASKIIADALQILMKKDGRSAKHLPS
jgi:hypothetical protein